MSRIRQTLELWTAVGELVDRLPGDWVLIGGLMVQLLALEHGMGNLRVTTDIDRPIEKASLMRRVTHIAPGT